MLSSTERNFFDQGAEAALIYGYKHKYVIEPNSGCRFFPRPGDLPSHWDVTNYKYFLKNLRT